MTVIPHVKNPADSTGLIKVKGIWYARYTVDGKYRRASLGTSDLLRATQKRNQFYANRIAEGASVAGTSTPKTKIRGNPESDLYIYKRLPYEVRIRGKVIAEAATLTEAREKRNHHLGIK